MVHGRVALVLQQALRCDVHPAMGFDNPCCRDTRIPSGLPSKMNRVQMHGWRVISHYVTKRKPFSLGLDLDAR